MWQSCYCYGLGWVGGSVNGFKVPPHWQTSLYCFRILYTTSLQTVGILENSGIILMPLCEVGPLKAILRTSWSLYCNSGSVIRVLSISLFFKIFFHICVCPNCLFLRQMDDILMQPIWASTNPICAHSRSPELSWNKALLIFRAQASLAYIRTSLCK